MRTRLAAAAALLLGCLALAAIGPGLAGGGELALFDAPRGAWLGMVRADAPLLVLEERDGWRRVRVEGWLPAPAEAPQRPAASVVRGVLSPAATEGVARPGAGLVVLLVPRLETLDAEHALLGRTCQEQARAAQERAARLRAEADRAMTVVENYREAMSRHDRLLDEARSADRDRLDLLRTCREKAVALHERHALQKTISDADGRFEFLEVPAGRYLVIAAEAAGDRPRSWVLLCTVSGPGPRVLDPRTDAAGLDLFWGLP